MPELLSAAFKVRHHYYGKRVQIHVLQNAKSGLCPEDCHYCSQSSVSDAPIDRYPFMSKEKLIEGAKAAKAAGAVRYCIVNSGRGPTNKEIDEITEAVRAIRQETGMNVCCSLGLMNQDKTEKLKAAGVGRVNHNLNTSRARHPEIVTTHTYDDRVTTIENVKQAGIGTCSGGMIGMGESDDDIIDLALTLRAMDIDSIPVNFLNSIPTTPFRKQAGTHAATLPKSSLPIPFRQSQQRDPRRRRPGNQSPLASAAQSLSCQLDVCERLPDHTGTRCLRCSPHDRRSRLRARFTGADRTPASAIRYSVSRRPYEIFRLVCRSIRRRRCRCNF